MESTSFFLWIGVVAAIAIFGLGTMIRAYSGSGSLAVLFTEPIAPNPAPSLNPEAATRFQQGCDLYRAQKYQQARDRFTQATQLDNTFAEAFHNLGLVTANLRQDNAAAQHLLQAGDRYLEQSNLDGYSQVKQALESLKARKEAKEKSLT
jgi:thioredoxin-like negative regulator of GroEL